MIDWDKVDGILKQQGKSRNSLSRATGISGNTIAAWFRRKTGNVPLQTVKAVAEVLDVPAREIVRDDVLDLLK